VQSDTSGDFPKEIAWYELSPLVTNLSSIATRHVPWSRVGSQETGSLSVPRTATASGSPLISPPSAVIAAWIPHSKNYLVPELWQYLLPPEEELRCLNLRQMIWDLNLDLQAFVIVGSRLLLLGYQGPPSSQSEATDDDDDDDDAVYNVCVEVSLGRQNNVGLFVISPDLPACTEHTKAVRWVSLLTAADVR
jgi:hypothetical protein